MVSRLGLIAATLLSAEPALAHTGAGSAAGFAAGFAHPLLGIDHVLAMGAVGLWAGLVSARALWAWPLAFLGVMIGGAVLAWSGSPLPGVEAMIALSLVGLGLAAAARAPLSVAIGALGVGCFALFHGFAHGAEAPAGSMAGYGAGFVTATALLHACGIGLGLAAARAGVFWLARGAGGAVAAAGLVLLVG